MKAELFFRLVQINREFYTKFAGPFSESRPESARELDRILPYITHGARVLDIGCGNGRLLRRLVRERADVTALGSDSSAALIEMAQDKASGDPRCKFSVADILEPDWIATLSQPQGPAPFDCILMLAVLHHIPDAGIRARVLRDIRSLLAPQARAIVSTWQFLGSERMRQKIVPWSAIGIDERELEPGDALLSWKRGGAGLRYCHEIGEDELRELAGQAGLGLRETFYAGGREGNLSLYAVLTMA